MRKFYLILVLMLISLVFSLAVFADTIIAKEEEVKKEVVKIIEKEIPKEAEETEKVAAAEEEVMEEITGLIIEQTMTRIGYDFYENFFILWKAPKGIKDYNIFISEKASSEWGSLVQIKVDSNVVWDRALKPRGEEIEEAAKEATVATKEFLDNYEEYKKQLGGEDMKGDGIF